LAIKNGDKLNRKIMLSSIYICVYNEKLIIY
jgi:hypothetical protein